MNIYTTVLNYGMMKLSTDLLKTVDYRYRGSKFVQKVKYNSRNKTMEIILTNKPTKAVIFLNNKLVGQMKAKIAHGFNGQVICIRNLFKYTNLSIPALTGFRYQALYNPKKKLITISLKPKIKTKKGRNS